MTKHDVVAEIEYPRALPIWLTVGSKVCLPDVRKGALTVTFNSGGIVGLEGPRGGALTLVESVYGGVAVISGGTRDLGQVKKIQGL